MKKIALLLAVLLVLGLLAACNAEKEKTPAQMVSGYDISIYDEGWKVVEDTKYDMQMVKEGVTMSVMGYTLMDFVDVPPAEDLYVDANEDMLEDKSVVVTAEKETSYEKNCHKYISTLFSAKDGEADMQYYCFMISFDDEAGSMAWVCFSATPEVMKQQKASLKKIVESMDANGEYFSPEELEEQLQEVIGEEDVIVDDMDEDPNDELPAYSEPVVEETEPPVEETEPPVEETEPPVEEETKPAEEETKPAEEETTGETVPEDQAPDATTGETEGTEPATEATEAATEATEATTAATE